VATELGEDVPEMDLDRAGGNEQSFGDLRARESFGCERDRASSVGVRLPTR
jgi:hypothetical protein